MDRSTLTRVDIAEALHREIGLPRSAARTMVDAILAHMLDAMERGENVKISGFGSFRLRDKRARPGRNPKNGVEAVVAARRVATFKASHILESRLQQQVDTESVP